MTDTIDKLSERTMFSALIAFTDRQEGYIHIPAKDEAHARELLTDMGKGKEGFEVRDLFVMDGTFVPKDTNETKNDIEEIFADAPKVIN